MTGGTPDAAFPRSLTVTAVSSGVLALVLGIAVAGERRPTAVDAAFESAVDESVGGTWLPHVLVGPTEPWAVLAVLVAVVAVGVVRRRADVVALAVVGPAFAVSLNTWVLKPAFGRYYDDHLAYPSGHTVSLVAAVTVVAFAVRSIRARVLTITSGGLLTAGAAVGMAGLDYHYVSDVAGGAATAVSLVSGAAVVTTAVLRRRMRSAATLRPAPTR